MKQKTSLKMKPSSYLMKKRVTALIFSLKESAFMAKAVTRKANAK